MKSTTTRALLLLLFSLAIISSGCAKSNTPQNDSQQGGEANAAAECKADLECGVGGCSNQVCTTAKDAPGLITTCEYKEEYGCLKLTSCQCISGKCEWANNSEYASCLENPAGFKQ